jgi:serine/threonine protein kinase HipA of HipAB toxin-antitoxin module
MRILILLALLITCIVVVSFGTINHKEIEPASHQMDLKLEHYFQQYNPGAKSGIMKSSFKHEVKYTN